MGYFKQVDLHIRAIGSGIPQEVEEQQRQLRRQFEQDMPDRQAPGETIA
jgi:hypothetical protein